MLLSCKAVRMQSYFLPNTEFEMGEDLKIWFCTLMIGYIFSDLTSKCLVLTLVDLGLEPWTAECNVFLEQLSCDAPNLFKDGINIQICFKAMFSIELFLYF